jgi:hypothetical protein
MARATSALLLLALAAAPVAARAQPTAACHCFKDRTFDPIRPAAADPYILATTRSSVLSAAFGATKRELVQEVMTGTDPDDLWVAYWAGARTGTDPGTLLQERGRKGSWKAVLSGAPASKLGPAFARALEGGAPTSALAALAVDDVLVQRLRADPAAVAELRAAGAASPETALALVIAPRAGMRPAEVLARSRDGRTTWGMLLDRAGMAPKGIDAAVREMAR